MSRFNDNGTGQQIQKLVLKARLEKKHFVFLPIQKLFLSKYRSSNEFRNVRSNISGNIFLAIYKFNLRCHTLKRSLKIFQGTFLTTIP